MTNAGLDPVVQLSLLQQRGELQKEIDAVRHKQNTITTFVSAVALAAACLGVSQYWLHDRLSDAKQTIEQIESKNAALTTQLGAIETTLGAMTKQLDETSVRITDADKSVGELHKSLKTLGDTVDLLAKQRADFERVVSAAKAELDQKKTAVLMAVDEQVKRGGETLAGKVQQAQRSFGDDAAKQANQELDKFRREAAGVQQEFLRAVSSGQVLNKLTARALEIQDEAGKTRLYAGPLHNGTVFKVTDVTGAAGMQCLFTEGMSVVVVSVKGSDQAFTIRADGNQTTLMRDGKDLR